jgi:SsrA-binding protein
MTRPEGTRVRGAGAPGRRVIASNRQARRNYEILETVEAGLALAGSEVKSLRESKVQLADAYARVEGGEVWLVSMHIAPYSHAQAHSGHDPDRRRKLLLHRAEIERLAARVDQERLTLVPLSLYFKAGRVKVELAVGRGRRTFDKRQAIAKRDAELEARRALSHRARE